MGTMEREGKGSAAMRLWIGEKEVNTEGLARLRVHVRSGKGKRVPMMGLLPREALDKLRSRLAAAFKSTGNEWRVEARVKSLESLDVRLMQSDEPRRGGRLMLAMSLREGAPRDPELASGLEELILEAERIKAQSGRVVETT